MFADLGRIFFGRAESDVGGSFGIHVFQDLIIFGAQDINVSQILERSSQIGRRPHHAANFSAS